MSSTTEEIGFEDIVAQWEPKIQRLIGSPWYIQGFDQDDLHQELLIVLWDCWYRFDPEVAQARADARSETHFVVTQERKQFQPASFHTYFHRAALNKLLKIRATVNVHNAPVIDFSVDDAKEKIDHGAGKDETDLIRKLIEALSVEMEVSIPGELMLTGLTLEELAAVELKAEGLTYNEIGERTQLGKKRAQEVIKSAKDKLKNWR